MELDKQVQDAVAQTIAMEILKGLDTENREAILVKSIKEALTDYSFRNSIEKVVAERAKVYADSLLQESGAYHHLLEDAVKNGINKLLQQIPEAIFLTLRNEIFGDPKAKDSYARSSPIARYLKMDKEEK